MNAWDGKFLQSQDIFRHVWLESTMLRYFVYCRMCFRISILAGIVYLCVFWTQYFRIEFVWVTPGVSGRKHMIQLFEDSDRWSFKQQMMQWEETGARKMECHRYNYNIYNLYVYDML